MDCSPQGSSVYGISQAKMQEWVAISYSRGSSDSGTEPASPALAGGFFTTGAIWKALSVLYFCTKENRSTINAQCHLISVVSYSNPMDLFHYKMLFHYVFTSLCLSKFVIYLFCSSQLCATNNCIDSSMQKSNQRNLKF